MRDLQGILLQLIRFECQRVVLLSGAFSCVFLLLIHRAHATEVKQCAMFVTLVRVKILVRGKSLQRLRTAQPFLWTPWN
jgi:hypothetical protein